jgi:hypothetical protein
MSYLMCMLCILGMRGEGGIELESLVAVVRIVFILNTKTPQRLVCSNQMFARASYLSFLIRLIAVFSSIKKCLVIDFFLAL